MTPTANDRASAAGDRPLVLHIFRAFRMAIHVPQIGAAIVALLALGVGNRLIDQFPFAPEKPAGAGPWTWERPLVPPEAATSTITVSSCVGFSGRMLELFVAPYASVFEPAGQLLRLDNSWSSAVYAATRLAWALVVWAFFGAVITRRAAVKFAIDESVPVRATVGFGRRLFFQFLVAPLLPAAGVLFFWLLLLVGGWIGRIPAAGPVLVGLFWFLALAFGFVIALILLSVWAGWPLMYAAISTEVSDKFDGFSRSLSYVLGRPWALLRYYAAAMVYGVVCVAFAVLFAFLVVYVAAWGVAAGMGPGDTTALIADSPFSDPAVPSNGDGGSESQPAESPPAATGGLSAAAGLAAFWLRAAALVVHGFAVSLFWTLATIVYFLLRHLDDATSLDEVFLTPADEPEDPLPFVGVAASEQPVVVRPLEKDPGDRTATDAEHSSQEDP